MVLDTLKEIIADAMGNRLKINADDIGENTEFIAGDVEKVLQGLIENRKIEPDIVMVDPPRKGLSSQLIKDISDNEIRNILYIS